MCALSSTSRSAMPRRQCELVDVVRGLIASRRNLSATFVLHGDGRIVRGREGPLTWLKDVFRRSKDNTDADSFQDGSGEVDRAAATAAAAAATAATTTLHHSEIAISKTPPGFSRKVGVINQQPANFGAERSMTKSANGKRNAGCTAGGRSAIGASSPARRVEIEENYESASSSTSWLAPHARIRRSRRNDGAIGESDAYHCYYASPRHCYRLPPRTMRSLLGTFGPDRSISGVQLRTIVYSATRNWKQPAVREPNAPEKREKKEEKKKDRKDKKKPVIRTDRGSVDSSEGRAAGMEAADNPRDDPVGTGFRYEWGVKLAEEPAAASAGDNDKFAEKGRRYVTKRLWGVNLKEPSDAVEDAASSADRGRGVEVHPGRIPAISEGDPDETRGGVLSASNTVKGTDASILKGTTAEYLSTEGRTQAGNFAAQQETYDLDSFSSCEALRRIMRTSPGMMKETLAIDDEYNIPEGSATDAEITAWRNLVVRSKTPVVFDKDEFLLGEHVDNLETLSIRPEAPQPKVDVQVVRSADGSGTKDIEPRDPAKSGARSVEMKHPVGSADKRKSDNYTSVKKLHTACAPVRYGARDANEIDRSRGSFLLSSVLRAVTREQPRSPRSKFASDPGIYTPSKTSDEMSERRNSERTDSREQHGGRSNNPDASDNSSVVDATRPSSLVETPVSRDDKEKREVDFPADEGTNVSLEDRSSDANDENLVRSRVAIYLSSESAREDDSVDKGTVQDLDHNDFQYADNAYVSSGKLSAGGVPIGSDASYVSKGSRVESADSVADGNERDVTADSDVKDPRPDDSSKEYIIDGEYVRIPGDPYPYSREHLEKWHVPRAGNFVYVPIKRDVSPTSESIAAAPRSPTPRNANDAYANVAAKVSYDSHDDGAAVTETERNGENGARTAEDASEVRVSSTAEQRAVGDCLLVGDAADSLGLQQWREAFSRFDATIVSGKMNGTRRIVRVKPL